jgi:predicted metal-dependent phosphoesterase TrpH
VNRYLRFDFHIHSDISSDSSCNIKNIIKYAKKAGLSGISITDHNSLKGSLKALETAHDGLILVPGVEYSTSSGHMLVYFLRKGFEDITGLQRDASGCFNFNQACAAAHEQGALVFMAHPFRAGSATDWDFGNIPDGIEIYNARSSYKGDMLSNVRAVDYAAANEKCYVAGSDAHYPAEIGRTFIEYDIRSISLPDTGVITDQHIRKLMLSKCGMVTGRASSRIFDPLGRISRCINTGPYGAIPVQSIRLCLSALKDTAGFFRIGRSLVQGRFGRYDTVQEWKRR